MILLFGGVPEVYYDQFWAGVKKQLNPGIDSFTSVKLLATASRTYEFDAAYCNELLRTLLLFIQGRPQTAPGGLAVILLKRPWERPDYSEHFRPFAFVQTVVVEGSTPRSGVAATLQAKAYVERAITACNRVRSAIKSLNQEYQAHLRRTPLLLPTRHFKSQQLDTLLAETEERLKQASLSDQAIRDACNGFEQIYPRQNVGRRSTFVNDSGVWFTQPGRALHGSRGLAAENGHQVRCVLNSLFRLGGYFDGGFHFDCTVGGGAHRGTFANCHDSTDVYRGRPHLNVYPNDFIR